MLYRLKIELYRVRKFISRSRDNGLNLPYIVLVHLPRLLIIMLYSKLAKRLNDRLLAVTINKLLISSFQKKYSEKLGDHFYVIVMPNTLHFLIPCLRLLPPEQNVFLVFNGAAKWERDLLIKEFNNRPALRLLTLRGSSINHGAVINLFLYANDKNFGIIDHDLYVFDIKVFNKLAFNSDEFMKAIFQGDNRFHGMTYPHTFFLFFNTLKIKKIICENHIDARTYKKVPKEIEVKLTRIGLSNRVFIKDYLQFFDTLHVILALLYVEGGKIDYLDTDDVYHLGGTSVGSQYAKDLSHMYISMCFLEYVNSPLLKNKYLPYLAPFTSSKQINEKLAPTPDVIQMKSTLHTILSKIHKADSQCV